MFEAMSRVVLLLNISAFYSSSSINTSTTGELWDSDLHGPITANKLEINHKRRDRRNGLKSEASKCNSFSSNCCVFEGEWMVSACSSPLVKDVGRGVMA